MAAPIASQVLGEVLPYLEVVKDNETEETVKEEVTMPRIIGMTVKEAQKVLKEYDLSMQIENEEEINLETAVVETQLPMNGIKIYKGSNIQVTINP